MSSFLNSIKLQTITGTYSSNAVLFVFIIALSTSCTTYEYLHSAQGSDYNPYIATFSKDTMIHGLQAGALIGSGFNATADGPPGNDRLDYGWLQWSGTRHMGKVDIGVGLKGYYGRFKETRDSIWLNDFFTGDPDSEGIIFNPLSGSRTLYGITSGIDLSIAPQVYAKTSTRWLGISYRLSYDAGAYAQDRVATDYFPVETEDLFPDLQPFQSQWLHSFGFFQDIFFKTNEGKLVRIGHQITAQPLFRDDRDDIKGGWTFYADIPLGNLYINTQATFSENQHITASLRYTF